MRSRGDGTVAQFDSTDAAGQNQIVRPRSRGLCSFLILAAILAGPCLNVCAGWAGSATARMACCIDKSDDDARACCASGESKQNAESQFPLLNATLPPSEPAALQFASAVEVTSATRVDFDSHDPLTSDSDRHVLLTVFLI